MADAQVERVTPHAFRRAVATVLSRNGSTEPAAERHGHSSIEITNAHHIEVDGLVDAATTGLLEVSRPAATDA